MIRASETLVGSIERVTPHNPDNAFAVLKTAAKGQRGSASTDHRARLEPQKSNRAKRPNAIPAV